MKQKLNYKKWYFTHWRNELIVYSWAGFAYCFSPCVPSYFKVGWLNQKKFSCSEEWTLYPDCFVDHFKFKSLKRAKSSVCGSEWWTI